MSLSKRAILTGIAVLLTLGLRAETTNSPAIIPPGYVKTNGEFVIIGRIMIETNSPLNTDEFKQYHWRVQELLNLANSPLTNSTDLLAEGAWKLIQDYPSRPNGYECIMEATENYEVLGETAKARAAAEKLADCSGPERYQLWAKGFLNRLDLAGNPISLQFTAVDGRKVDLANMKGKVVLVDFWATGCGPCVAELPRIKAAYNKYHGQGFEIIGISCDTDQERLKQFLTERSYPWPEYFDGHQQESNKFAQGFGIDGIPHMFLIDKKGALRFDNVRAKDAAPSQGDRLGFEEKISKLLAEN